MSVTRRLLKERRERNSLLYQNLAWSLRRKSVNWARVSRGGMEAGSRVSSLLTRYRDLLTLSTWRGYCRYCVDVTAVTYCRYWSYYRYWSYIL